MVKSLLVPPVLISLLEFSYERLIGTHKLVWTFEFEEDWSNDIVRQIRNTFEIYWIGKFSLGKLVPKEVRLTSEIAYACSTGQINQL